MLHNRNTVQKRNMILMIMKVLKVIYNVLYICTNVHLNDCTTYYNIKYIFIRNFAKLYGIYNIIIFKKQI